MVQKWLTYFSSNSAQEMRFSFKDCFSQCNFFNKFRWIWSQLLKKSLMENLSSEILIKPWMLFLSEFLQIWYLPLDWIWMKDIHVLNLLQHFWNKIFALWYIKKFNSLYIWKTIEREGGWKMGRWGVYPKHKSSADRCNHRCWQFISFFGPRCFLWDTMLKWNFMKILKN